MSKIKVMSQELANMIAAGEVIERPSSVIKELAENSIDAGAKNIRIEVFNSGKDLISVQDDGEGMDREDAQLAFKRHASSKLRSIYDLMRISTLGFRGEALPSIASISHMHMLTSSGNGVGSEIFSEPDKELTVHDASLRKGTLIEVKELFYNTPARLKYLKGERTENASSIEMAQHLALGFPGIAFTLLLDGKEVFSTTGRGNLLETIASIYGNDIAKQCLSFKCEGEGFEAEGFIAHPSISYSTRYDILTFLNNRAVYIPKAQKAIVDGYKDYLPPSRYPLTIIHFKVDYALVDVNVHPSKKEVRLTCEEEMALVIYKSIRQTLLATRTSFDQVKMDQREEEKTALHFADSIQSTQTFVPSFKKEDNPAPFVPSPLHEAAQEIKKDDISPLFETEKSESAPFAVNDSHGYEEKKEPSVPLTFSSHSTFPSLTPIGQVLQTYIVCDSTDGIYLVDQHAAAERINFEKCEDDFKKQKDRVVPLFPFVMDLTPAMKNNYDEKHIKALCDLNILTSPFGPSSIKAEEVPSFLAEKDDDSVLRDLITQILSDNKVDIADIERKAIATKACKMSIKANNVLSRDEQIALIKTLSDCRNPLNCPHGRPTVIKISKYEIEKLFKRSGF
jgi:DNA mismatch repair protein MutL